MAVQHISAEEIDESEDESASPNPKPFLFDRLQPFTLKKRLSVFTHLRKGKDHKISVFNRIKDVSQPKRSVFARIETGEESSSSQL